MELSKLFNGMQVKTVLQSEPGKTATQERENDASYELELNVKVKVPKANQSLNELSRLNEALPKVLPGLAAMLPQARVAPSYEALYQRKLGELQRDMSRLDQLLSRHNFFDCETILELRNPQTKRAAVLLQADMDVDMDGSDADRLPPVDGSSSTFQPMTSYRWPKVTELLNPFLPSRQARLLSLESELQQAKGMGASRLHAIRDRVGAAQYEVTQLKKNSFLLAATDPYVVLPGAMANAAENETDPAFTPHVGDYCVVIYGDTIYPAIVGDVGPSGLVGEASYRLAKELNAKANADSRSVSTLKVTYLFFPNSADKPFGPPNLVKWHDRAAELLKEFGGYGGTLHLWEELSRPAPTPTPTPVPTPTPTMDLTDELLGA
ncbi:MAG: glycoside hydrolase family 75 protein [Verrucomicrobiota bacterium]